MGDTVFYMRSSSPDGINSPYSDQAIDDLRKFVRLPDDTFEKTLSSLEHAPTFVDKSDLVELLRQQLLTGDAELVARVIRWMNRVSREGSTIEQICSELALIRRKRTGQEEPAFQESDLKLMKSRGDRLSAVWHFLERQHKAEELCKVTGMRLQSAQFVCDLRPIFDSERETIEGLLPVTTLRIVAEGIDGIPCGMDVILSEADLQRIDTQVTHARRKIAASKAVSEQLGIPVPTTDLTNQVDGAE